MKFLFILAFITSTAFATSRSAIEGSSATTIISIFEQAGILVQQTDYGDFIEVKQLDCLDLKCTAQDYSNKTLNIEGANATTLYKLFSEAGAVITNKQLTVKVLDCIGWSVVAGPGETQEVPTCLFR